MKFWANGELVPLADLAVEITDGDHMPPPKSEMGVPFITIGNIDKVLRTIDFSQTFRVSYDYFKAIKANRRPKRGDVLYTVTGSFGIPVIVDGDTEFCFQRHIALVRPKPETSSAWLYYLLLSPQMYSMASEGATGTAQKTVGLSVLRNFRVPRVSLQTQQLVVSQLDLLSTQTRQLETVYAGKLSALEQLKKSLLHQAFTGQL